MPKMNDRLVYLTEDQQCARKICVRVGIIGPQCNRAPVVFRRILDTTKRSENQRDVVAVFRMTGVLLDRAL